MTATPKPVRDLVQQEYESRQIQLENLKGNRQFARKQVERAEKAIEDAERDLESMADWLRANP